MKNINSSQHLYSRNYLLLLSDKPFTSIQHPLHPRLQHCCTSKRAVRKALIHCNHIHQYYKSKPKHRILKSRGGCLITHSTVWTSSSTGVTSDVRKTPVLSFHLYALLYNLTYYVISIFVIANKGISLSLSLCLYNDFVLNESKTQQ